MAIDQTISINYWKMVFLKMIFLKILSKSKKPKAKKMGVKYAYYCCGNPLRKKNSNLEVSIQIIFIGQTLFLIICQLMF